MDHQLLEVGVAGEYGLQKGGRTLAAAIASDRIQTGASLSAVPHVNTPYTIRTSRKEGWGVCVWRGIITSSIDCNQN